MPMNELTHDVDHMRDMGLSDMDLRYRSILPEAQKMVHDGKQGDYGHPLDNFTLTGKLWGAYLGIGDISPEDVAILKVLMKVSREKNKHIRDNHVDIAGYAETAEMIHHERENRK